MAAGSSWGVGLIWRAPRVPEAVRRWSPLVRARSAAGGFPPLLDGGKTP